MKKRTLNPLSAFTLIELLVVVAVIAILASIAVPNFLVAEIRAKTARAKNDMRTMSLGIESFGVDHNGYPTIFTRMNSITTPVPYITSLPRDAFRLQQSITDTNSWRQKTYRYGAMPLDVPSMYALASVGPDTDIDTYSSINTGGGADTEDTANFEADNSALRFYPGYTTQLFSAAGAAVNSAVFKYIAYDPTNGAISDGDVFRLSDHPSDP